MKQAAMTEPGRIEIRQVEPPRPGRGEVLLRVRRIGICGSDVHVWHGRHPYTGYPVVQGHEFSATVEELGPGASGPAPGRKVTALPQITCGRCGPCRRGAYHICDHLKVQGFQAPGCAQELFAVPAERIVPLPESFTFEQGAMVEPAAVAVHAVGRAGQVAGRNAVVLGAGPIGNLVAQVVQAEGARVLATDLSDHRLGVARQCGLAPVSNAGTETLTDAARRAFGGEGFSLAFEAVGVDETVTAAVGEAEKGAIIVIVGVFGHKPRVDLGLVQDRELDLRGTLMYRREDYDQAIRLMESGQVRTAPLESRHFPLHDYAAAYQAIEREGDRLMKVFIDV